MLGLCSFASLSRIAISFISWIQESFNWIIEVRPGPQRIVLAYVENYSLNPYPLPRWRYWLTTPRSASPPPTNWGNGSWSIASSSKWPATPAIVLPGYRLYIDLSTDCSWRPPRKGTLIQLVNREHYEPGNDEKGKNLMVPQGLENFEKPKS